MSLWSERCFIVSSWYALFLIWSLIRPICVGNGFWSEPVMLEPFMIRTSCAQSVYVQTQLHPNCLCSDSVAREPFFTRSSCTWRRLRSHPAALEVVYNQTPARSNPPLIRRKCAWNCPIILSAKCSAVRSKRSDHHNFGLTPQPR